MRPGRKFYTRLIQNRLTVAPPVREAWNYFKSKVYAGRNTVNYAPVHIILKITNRCNMSCPSCVYSRSDVKKDMTPDMFARIVDGSPAKRALFYSISGGEPLVSGHVFDFCAELKKRGKIVGLVSNGLLLERYAGELSGARLDFLSLTLYDGSLEVISRNAPGIIRKTYTRANRLTGMSTYTSMESIIRYAHDVGFDSLVFINHACIDSSCETIFDDDTEFLEYQAGLKDKYKGVRMDIEWLNPAQKVPSRVMCRALNQYVLVDTDGAVTYCCGRPETVFGSIFDADFWNCRKIVDKRSMLHAGKVPDICNHCYMLGYDYFDK